MINEGIHLRRYLGLFLGEWHVILACVLIAAVSALIFTVLRSDIYAAEATIAILRTRTEVEFDSRVRTLSDYELAGAGTIARQDALVALVRGNQVVQQVLTDVGDHIDPEERNITNLRDMVEAQTSGDLININVRHEDPEVAALIANSWAEHYEQYVNSIYSGSPLNNSNVANQVSNAEQHYNQAQRAFEEFTAEDQSLTLEREIESREALLQTYRQTLNRIQVSPTETSQALLLDYYRETQLIENWLVAANSLREQVGRDSNSPAAELGNAVALLMLRSRIFGGESGSTAISGVVPNATGSGGAGNETRSGTDLVFQFDLSNAAENGISVADVDTVIEVLEQRREDAQSRIDSLVEAVNSGSETQLVSETESQLLTNVAALESEIVALRSELETQTARRRELEQARDRTWDTYLVLVGRQVEEEIVSESPAAEVRIADMAVVPTQPAPRGLIQNTALAGLAAMMLSIGAIIAWDWWKSGESEFVKSVQDESLQGSENPQRTGPPTTTPSRAGQLSDRVT